MKRGNLRFQPYYLASQKQFFEGNGLRGNDTILLSPELSHVMSVNHGPLHKCVHFQKLSQMTRKLRCGQGWFPLSRDGESVPGLLPSSWWLVPVFEALCQQMSHSSLCCRLLMMFSVPKSPSNFSCEAASHWTKDPP